MYLRFSKALALVRAWAGTAAAYADVSSSSVRVGAKGAAVVTDPEGNAIELNQPARR
jgi:hypothetical protein